MTALPVVGIVGTSIADGTGAPNGESYLQVACRNHRVPYIILGKGGESLSILNTAANHAVRYGLLTGLCTDVVIEHGVNDLGATFATFQSRYNTLWTALAALKTGMRVWQCTLPPSYNSSTDAWLTTANQTKGTNDAVRVLVNNWMRDGAPYAAGSPAATGTVGAVRCAVYDSSGGRVSAASGTGHPLAGVFEVADSAESARDSGLWKADGTTAGKYTTDGVHPNPSSTAQTASMALAVATGRIIAAHRAAQITSGSLSVKNRMLLNGSLVKV